MTVTLLQPNDLISACDQPSHETDGESTSPNVSTHDDPRPWLAVVGEQSRVTQLVQEATPLASCVVSVNLAAETPIEGETGPAPFVRGARQSNSSGKAIQNTVIAEAECTIFDGSQGTILHQIAPLIGQAKHSILVISAEQLYEPRSCLELMAKVGITFIPRPTLEQMFGTCYPAVIEESIRIYEIATPVIAVDRTQVAVYGIFDLPLVYTLNNTSKRSPLTLDLLAAVCSAHLAQCHELWTALHLSYDTLGLQFVEREQSPHLPSSQLIHATFGNQPAAVLAQLAGKVGVDLHGTSRSHFDGRGT